jgi:hypothetical protein
LKDPIYLPYISLFSISTYLFNTSRYLLCLWNTEFNNSVPFKPILSQLCPFYVYFLKNHTVIFPPWSPNLRLCIGLLVEFYVHCLFLCHILCPTCLNQIHWLCYHWANLITVAEEKNPNYVMKQKCDTLHSIKHRADPRHVGTPGWHMPKLQIIFGESHVWKPEFSSATFPIFQSCLSTVDDLSSCPAVLVHSLALIQPDTLVTGSWAVYKVLHNVINESVSPFVVKLSHLAFIACISYRNHI